MIVDILPRVVLNATQFTSREALLLLIAQVRHCRRGRLERAKELQLVDARHIFAALVVRDKDLKGQCELSYCLST